MTSVYHQEPAGFNLVLSACFFFTLKAMGPIHCHYMTDRLQRFELNILVCVVLSPTSWRPLSCNFIFG